MAGHWVLLHSHKSLLPLIPCFLYIVYKLNWCIFILFMNNIAVKRKRCILLLSTSHFIHLTPKRKFRLNLLPQTILIGPIYPLLKFLFFYFFTYKWNFSFKFCNVTCNTMPYAKRYIIIFSWIFFMHDCISVINFLLNISNLWK